MKPKQLKELIASDNYGLLRQENESGFKWFFVGLWCKLTKQRKSQ